MSEAAQVHPGTSRRLPSGWRAVVDGMWPVVVVSTLLGLVALGVAWALVWVIS
jgi:hypothetical protein